MRPELKEAFGEARYYLKSLSVFLLSHHPGCRHFEGDTIRIGKLRFCKGCTIGYSLALSLMVFYMVIFSVYGPFIPVGPFVLILLGALFGSTQLVRAIFRRMSPAMKTVQKAALGLGIALVVIGILEIPASAFTRMFLLLGLLLVIGITSAVLRPWYILRTCRECEYESEWERCDAFRELYRSRNEHDCGRSAEGH